MNKFKSDLIFGKKYEKAFLNIINAKDFKIMEGNFKEYDLEVYNNNKITKYEIKSDRLTTKTGNICIEYRSYGKDSGISTSESDYYGYFEVIDSDNHILYLIPTNYIKDCIKDKKYTRTMKGGDNYKSEFYLFKKNLFDNYIYEDK